MVDVAECRVAAALEDAGVAHAEAALEAVEVAQVVAVVPRPAVDVAVVEAVAVLLAVGAAVVWVAVAGAAAVAPRSSSSRIASRVSLWAVARRMCC